MKELAKFRRWANSHRSGRGLLCHFYMEERKKQRQYYTKPDYAYFNLFSNSSDWIIKGTIGHGITSERGKKAQVPCLNCYKINNDFYDGLATLLEEGNQKYELGIVFDKAELKKDFEVVDVMPWDHKSSRPPPDDCWRYDIPSKKTALWPFNYCDVVRVKIRPSKLYGLPIKAIPSDAVMGLLVKEEGYDHAVMTRLLQKKKWDEIEEFGIFPLL